MVAHLPSKQMVASSSLVSRSNEFTASIKFEAVNYLMAGTINCVCDGEANGGFVSG